LLTPHRGGLRRTPRFAAVGESRTRGPAVAAREDSNAETRRPARRRMYVMRFRWRDCYEKTWSTIRRRRAVRHPRAIARPTGDHAENSAARTFRVDRRAPRDPGPEGAGW